MNPGHAQGGRLLIVDRELDRNAQGQRLRLARELAGMTREDLGKIFEQEGFGRHDIAAIERQVETAEKAREVRFTPARKALGARVLQVPEGWFTNTDYWLLFKEPLGVDQAGILQEQIDALRSSLEQVIGEQDEADELAEDELSEPSDSHSEGLGPGEASG